MDANIKIEAAQLWQKFKQHYANAIGKYHDDVTCANGSGFNWSNRTAFNQKLLEDVVKEMKSSDNIAFKLEREILHIDFAISTNEKDHFSIPKIFVEHENDIDTEPEHHEILKLCLTSVPLKIFITWHPNWEDERENCLMHRVDWWYIIKDVMKEQKNWFGILAIIVAEMKSGKKVSLKYFATTWNESVEDFENDEIIFTYTQK